MESIILHSKQDKLYSGGVFVLQRVLLLGLFSLRENMKTT